MRNVSHKSCRKNLLCSIFFFENRAVYEIMWKNIVDPDRPQMTKWRMLIGCLIPKAKNLNSEYVILFALPLQEGLLKAHQCYVIRIFPLLLINIPRTAHRTGM
jgi:hypothetical protein